MNPCVGLGRHAHFENFGMAFLTLFRIATGDNWNGIMKVIEKRSSAILHDYYTIGYTQGKMHICRRLPTKLLRFSHNCSHIFCYFCTYGPVCSCECGSCSINEAFRSNYIYYVNVAASSVLII